MFDNDLSGIRSAIYNLTPPSQDDCSGETVTYTPRLQLRESASGSSSLADYNVTSFITSESQINHQSLSGLTDKFFGELEDNRSRIQDCWLEFVGTLSCASKDYWTDIETVALNNSRCIFDNSYLSDGSVVFDHSISQELIQNGLLLLVYLYVCLKYNDCFLNKNVDRSEADQFIKDCFNGYKEKFGEESSIDILKIHEKLPPDLNIYREEIVEQLESKRMYMLPSVLHHELEQEKKHVTPNENDTPLVELEV